MREHNHKVTDQAPRPGERIGIDGRRRPPLRLAVETIRLAREAVSTHLILSARLRTEVDPDVVGALAVPESAR